MKIRWSTFGGQAGLGFILLGLLLVFLGWNGAASLDRVPSQFPYLISGGVAGLCLVLLGVGLLIVQNHREDRAKLQASMDELRRTLEQLAEAGVLGSSASAAPVAVEADVVAGPTAYHRPSCRLLEGRGSLPALTAAEAAAKGLRPCRTCSPPTADGDEPASEPADAEQTQRIPSGRGKRATARRSASR